MKLRTRVASVLAMLVMLIGVGASVEANASLAKKPGGDPDHVGCVVLMPLKTTICIPPPPSK